MYKLLTTTAIIIATASSASAWDGAANLTKKLNTIYTNVDGTDQFNNLQANGGELNTFLGDASAGVTYVTLNVDGDNQISTGINKGKTLVEITDAAGDLVNRINYDLFYDTTPEVATDDGTIAGGYNAKTDYTLAQTEVESLIGYTVGINGDGLVGNKVNDIVGGVNSINTGLVDAADIVGGATAAEQNTAFIAAFDGNLNETHFGVNIQEFNADITELNLAVETAGGSNFFGNTTDFTVDGSSISAFQIPGFVSDTNGITITDGAETYTSILDWANAQ